ncbi:MAG TPA: TCR/Tet family MFS transporter [Steroidobacteraceae bacterium]|nr:TCR/Tet family MFS transporter [Steroidobacteraceae bacterium]
MKAVAAGQRAVVFIFITVLIDSISFGIVLPVLPQLIVELTGVQMGQAAAYGGWLSFAYAAVQFFCAPVLGNLSDRFGRRPVLLSALFVLGLDYLIMGVAPTIGWLFFGRIVAGVTGASYTPAYAYMADITPPEKRAQNFGLLGAAFGGGFILGPLVGGLLGILGPRAPFFAAAGLALFNSAFGLFALPETLPPESRRSFAWARANPLGTLLQLRKFPVVLWLAGAMFLWQLAHQVLPSVWSFYTILKFGWSTAQVGYSLAVAGIVLVIGQGLLTRTLIPRFGGERNAAMIGLLFGGLTYLGYGLATQGWMMYAWLIAWLLGSFAYPSMNAVMSRQVAPNAQGELQGGVASLFSLSAILGPPLMTQLFSYFSRSDAPVYFPGAAFVAAALLVGGSIGLYLVAMRHARHGTASVPEPGHSS